MMFRVFLTLLFCLTYSNVWAADMRKRIAITYDDAPRGDGRLFSGEARTQALIEQWEDSDVGPVVIFATTRGLSDEAGRQRLKAYADAGHLIANHSQTHPWASRTDVEEYLNDIDQAEIDLAGYANRRDWFRFPFLDEGGYGEDKLAARKKRDKLRDGLEARSLRNGYVTVDTYDWHMDRRLQEALKAGRDVDQAALIQVYSDMVVEAAEHYDQMALDVLGHRPAQILLLHENDVAALATEAMIEALRNEGWMIIHPDEAYADETLRAEPQTLFAGMGRIAALASEAGRIGADYFDHWSADEAGIDDRLKAAEVFKP